MALLTGGTNASTSLSALKVNPGDPSPADVGTFANLIKNDQNTNAPGPMPTAYSYNGMLFVPNRGVLRCLPGDYVMVDTTTGWPILVSANAIANGPWAHS